MLARLLGAALAALVAGVIGAAPAAALTLSPDPLVLAPDGANTDPGFGGVLKLVDVVSGVPVGAAVLAGSVAAGDVTLVFEASLDASAAETALFFLVDHPETIDSAYAGVRYTGAGVIAGGGHDITAASLSGAYAYFLLAGTGLAPGGSMDLVFLSIPGLSAGTPFEGALANVGSYGAGSATFVPEPAAATLVAWALLLAGAEGLRRRTSGPL